MTSTSAQGLRAGTTSALVITDNEAPERFAKALVQALRVCGRDIELVAVTDRPHSVPDKVRRRARVVRLRAGQDVRDAVAAEVSADRLTVVACSSARFAPGWLAAAEATAMALPHHIGVLGAAGHVIVVPAAVKHLTAAETPLVELAGVTLPCGQVRAGAGGAPATVKLSAVLIAKDEEEVLGECLEALTSVVDEIVVYDTGSSDATPAVAEAHGAVVVHGYWNDNFADARNRALEHATGDWVLSVDADEVLTGDVSALRTYCAQAGADVMRVPIINTTWKGAQDGQRFQPVRLFRRARCRWTGALHEFLVEREGQPALTMSHLIPPIRLDHSGYQYLTFNAKDKAVRNLDISRAAVDALEASGEDPITAWDGYGRSLMAAGRHREAVDALHHVLATQTNSSAVLQSGRAALACMQALGDWTEAQEWLTALEAHGESLGNVIVWRSRHAMATGDLDSAERLLDEAVEAGGADRWGVVFDPIATMGARAEVAFNRGDPARAVDILVDTLNANAESIQLPGLVQVATLAQTPIGQLIDRLPEAFLDRSVQEAVVLPVEAGDAWLTVLHDRRPDDLQVVVAGTVVGGRASLERAVAWSAIARGKGQPQLCPLRILAEDEERTTRDRALAWALLVDVAGDEAAVPALAVLLEAASDDERDHLLATIAALAPGAITRLTQLVAAVG